MPRKFVFDWRSKLTEEWYWKSTAFLKVSYTLRGWYIIGNHGS